jgi:dUTPase
VGVRDGAGLAVPVGAGLAVRVRCGLAVRVGSGLAVRVGCGVAVRVGSGLAVRVGCGVAVRVGSGLAVRVGCGVAACGLADPLGWAGGVAVPVTPGMAALPRFATAGPWSGRPASVLLKRYKS